jgi:hypothetical protein
MTGFGEESVMDPKAIDPKAIDLTTIDPRLVREMLVMNEIFKLRPPTTAEQAAARRKADEELEAKYPLGCHVAYVDNWSGDELDRVVVAASVDWDKYQAQLKQLPLEVRERIEITQLKDPEEGLRGIYPSLADHE